MGKKTLIISLAMVALSGCTFPIGQEEEPEEIATNQEQDFTKPTFSPKSEPEPPIQTLIPSTDPKERTENLDKGRNDPFAVIPIEPIITIERIPTVKKEVKQTPPAPKPPTAPPQKSPTQPPQKSPTAPPQKSPTQPPQKSPTQPPQKPPTPPPQKPPIPQVNRNNRNESTNTRTVTKPETSPKEAPSTPQQEPKVQPKPPLPPKPPQPVLAKGITVTGLIQVGEVTKIIVKAPEEKYSRYVEAGQYLSNGQVLVKRIETKGKNPIVVLEQLGMEVIKQVGDQAV